MKLFRIISLILVLTGVSLAQEQSGSTFETSVSGTGTSAVTFLEIGIGARAMGMGGAYAAVANDVSALYWNPAGIVWTNTTQVEVTHNDWFMDAGHEFAGTVVPLPQLNSAIGVSFSTIGFDEQPVRTVTRPEGTGETYDARDFAFGLTFATALTEQFSFGLTGKYINSRIWSESGTAFALDLGIFYNTDVEGLRLGFSMSNFGTDIQYSGRQLETTKDPDESVENFDRVPAAYKTESYPIPLLFRAGISYDMPLGGFGNALLSLDLNHPSNAPESVNAGMEYGFGGMFFIRAGYESLFEDDAENGLTLGAGVDYYNNQANFGVRFDYAWADWGILEDAQRFSVGIIF